MGIFKKILKKSEQPFSRNPFMMGYDSNIFEADDDLGFVFPDHKLITSNNFSTLQNIISLFKPSDVIILNLGDSSTSGRNSNKICKGAKDPTAVFFTYKTYSQLMEEQGEQKVINAGVPGYSSLQGKKYLEMLLKKLSKNNILVDYVTIYFGNNDSTFNEIEDKVRIDYKKSFLNKTGFRVEIGDFKKNIYNIIEITKEYGALPIIISPLINYNWEPCIRSPKYKQEFEEAILKIKDKGIKTKITQAINCYKRGNLKKAKELDLVLPRIKDKYRKALFEVASKNDVLLIDVQEKIPFTNTKKYFADYCHPIEKSNQMIVDKILQFIKTNNGKINKKEYANVREFDIPDKTYTLY